jgi:hypothetical protein
LWTGKPDRSGPAEVGYIGGIAADDKGLLASSAQMASI